MKIASLLLAFAAVAQCAIIPREEHPARMNDLRERALSRLPKAIADELRARDPSTYDLPLDDLIAEERSLVKRQAATVYTTCKPGKLAATYDDGIWQYHKNVTDIWKAGGHVVTFFVNLKNYDCGYDSPYSDYGLDGIDQGMTLCSHGSHHLDLRNLTMAQIDEELTQVETYTWKVFGLIPNCFRPPFGGYTEEILVHLKSKYGYDVIMSDIDSKDWQVADTDPEQSIQVWQQIKDAGHIILNHETHLNSITKIAPAAIAQLEKIGVKSTGIADCIGRTTSYKVFDKTKRQKRDATWKCT